MPQSVLIIDDSPEIHALLKVRLRSEGVDLRHALDPAVGLALVRESPPDLVLLDVDMPGQSGFEVCKALKADPQTAPIPVIFLTGQLDQQKKVEGLDLGAMDYVTKPFDVAELRARVRSALRMKSLQDQLIALARIDQLTGLWNRACFDASLERELAIARRAGRHVALILFDVDHFKRVNDGHGHPAGDAVLRVLGARLRAMTRATDVACRFGGEEFALILPGVTSPHQAVEAANRIREAVAATPFDTGDLSLPVTVSLGVASTVDLAATTAAELLAQADAALYEAKRTGRDRVCLYEFVAVARRLDGEGGRLH